MFNKIIDILANIPKSQIVPYGLILFFVGFLIIIVTKKK